MRQEFTCGECGESSHFGSRCTVLVFNTGERTAENPARTYTCEHCGARNKIDLPSGKWLLVDAEVSGNG